MFSNVKESYATATYLRTTALGNCNRFLHGQRTLHNLIVRTYCLGVRS